MRSFALRLAGLVLLVVVCLVAAEFTARAYWAVSYGVPFLQPDRILYVIYPELRRIDRKQPRADDGFYDVLLLGGSVLHKEWGVVAPEVRKRLKEAGIEKPRVFQLAAPAHTSRDSLLKYAAMEDAEFELVVVYNGINETRANNVPPELFRDDYTHYAWYETANLLAEHHGRSHFALPYTLSHAWLRLRQLLEPEHYVPFYCPRHDWLDYGVELRSTAALRRNGEEIVAIARERGDPLALMSFAIHVPDDYSFDAFEEKRLDYRNHTMAINDWGHPENVVAGVEAHNRALAEVAGAAPEVLFVDQAALMPRGATWFDDVCHLTPVGASRLVDGLFRASLARWPAREMPPQRRGAEGASTSDPRVSPGGESADPAPPLRE